MSGEAVIEVEGATASFGGPPVIEDVDFRVEAGEFVGIVGPNGGGKTTLLRVILGLMPVSRGRVRLFGEPPTRGRRRVGYVPQYPRFSRDFPVSVRQLVLTGRLGASRGWLRWRREDHAIAERALDEAEIGGLAERPIGALSGGELQRALIARALATDPGILLLDEPTANIDPRVEHDFFELLRALNQRITIIVVTHDIGFVSQYVGRVACLNRTLVHHGTEALTPAVVEQLYGHPVRLVDHQHGHG